MIHSKWLCCVAAVLLWGTAAAQTVLPEVSVSATRVERDSMDVPAAIDTVDRRAIREANPQVNLSESLARVPGLAVQNRQNYAQDLQVSSRGFGARSAFGVRGVRLIADGIPATMPDGQGQAATFNLPSAARIEVLRGPFSSLYGNASGGVVQVFTADAPATPTVSGSFLFGSDATWKAGVQYGGRHGAVDAVADLSRFETDGYRDHSSARRDSGNAKVRFDLGTAGKLTLVVNALDQPETEDPLGLTAAQVAQNPRQAVSNAYLLNTRKSIAQTQGGLTWELALAGGHALSARAYAGDRQVTQHLGIPLINQQPQTHSGGVVDLDRGYGGVGLRWTRRGDWAARGYELTAGVDYDRMSERRRGFLNVNGVTGALKRDEDDTVSTTDVYAQGEWQVTKQFAVFAGARHSRVRFESEDYFIVPGTANGNDSGSVDYSRTTPVAGATYRVTPTLNLYANVGRGFETPTFAELAYRPGGAAGLNFALRPSRSLHREFGVKTLIGGDGQLNAALFRIDTRDEIVVNSSSGGRTDFRNASGTKREGFELGWQQKWGAGFSSVLAWTLLDATFKDAFTPGGGGPVAAGSRLPGVAANQLYAELVWRHAASGLHAGIEVRHSGKLYVNDQNSEAAGAYTVANLRLGLQQKGKGWRASEFVRVDNAFDKAYVGSVIVAEGSGRFYEPSPGRTAMIGVTLEFTY